MQKRQRKPSPAPCAGGTAHPELSSDFWESSISPQSSVSLPQSPLWDLHKSMIWVSSIQLMWEHSRLLAVCQGLITALIPWPWAQPGHCWGQGSWGWGCLEPANWAGLIPISLGRVMHKIGSAKCANKRITFQIMFLVEILMSGICELNIEVCCILFPIEQVNGLW